MAALLPRPPLVPPAGELKDALSTNLRRFRHVRGLTLDGLALECGVSRAMISKIERGTAVPTATVLGKLAAGLKVGLSQLVGTPQVRAPVVITPNRQAIYEDPQSGLVRRSLSPLFPDRMVDLALNTLPPGGHVVFPPHQQGVEEYLSVNRGELVVIIDQERFELTRGSTMFYPGDTTHEYINESADIAEFLVVVDGTGAR